MRLKVYVGWVLTDIDISPKMCVMDPVCKHSKDHSR